MQTRCSQRVGLPFDFEMIIYNHKELLKLLSQILIKIGCTVYSASGNGMFRT